MYEHADPLSEGMLPVSDVHSLYYIQYGNPKGKPVIFVHGGPGGSVSKKSAQFFDPAIYRVILFNQRGAGKSVPLGSIHENTTPHLVSDMEKLREHCSVEKWHMVFGGSWGSALGLAYAQAHPQRVGSLVLRGIFLGESRELKTTISDAFFPEVQEEFLSFLSAEEKERAEAEGGQGEVTYKTPMQAYYRRMTCGDKAVEMAAAKAWNAREVVQSRLQPLPGNQLADKLEDEDWSISHARLEAHYFVNDCFLEDGQLTKPENLAKIQGIPTSIVQGRYDVVCPPVSAWNLHRGLERQGNGRARLYMIPDAGHDAYEPGTAAKLVEICDEYGGMEF